MIVIVVVGVLSAVALPQFLGVRDKAKIGAEIGELVGLAKECSSAITISGPYPDQSKQIDIGATAKPGANINCRGTTAADAPGGNVIYTSDEIKDELAGTVACGPDDAQKLTVAKPSCQITVNYTNGALSFAAV